MKYPLAYAILLSGGGLLSTDRVELSFGPLFPLFKRYGKDRMADKDLLLRKDARQSRVQVGEKKSYRVASYH